MQATGMMPSSSAGNSYASMLARMRQLASGGQTAPQAIPAVMPAPVAIAAPQANPALVAAPVAISAPVVIPAPAGGNLADAVKAAYQNLIKRLSDFAKGVFSPGEASKPAESAQPAAPVPAAGANYTVRQGDTLSAIAMRMLGDGNRWREIYDLNRDVIGSNPNLILPGQTFRLPGGATTPPPVQAAPKAEPKAAPSGKWAWPVAGRKTSNYGMRKHPISGDHRMHTGLDIGAATGTPTKTPQAGKVSFAGWKGGYGNYVVVDHGNGLQTAYAHLSKITVSQGQSVAAGTVVGKVGSTGNSTGPHLHFEVKRNGNFVDPKTMLA